MQLNLRLQPSHRLRSCKLRMRSHQIDRDQILGCRLRRSHSLPQRRPPGRCVRRGIGRGTTLDRRLLHGSGGTGAFFLALPPCLLGFLLCCLALFWRRYKCMPDQLSALLAGFAPQARLLPQAVLVAAGHTKSVFVGWLNRVPTIPRLVMPRLEAFLMGVLR